MHRFSRTALAYLLALILGPLGLLLIQSLSSTWSGRLLFIVIFVPVLIAAWLGGTRPGVLAIVITIVAYVPINWERLQSTRQWTNYLVSVAVYLTLGTLFSWLISALQSARRRAESERQVRREAEHNVHEERERLRVTLSSIGDAVIVTDMNGNVTFMNPVAANLTGWASVEAAGQPLEQVFCIVNEQTKQVVENPVSKVLRERVVVGLANHTVLIAKNGREIPIDDSGAPVRGDDGAIVGVVLVFRDVTETRRAIEARLYLAAIVESSDDAIISKNLDGIITSWNQGSEKLYGYTAKEAVGKPISIVVPPNRMVELMWIMERIGRGERVEHFETQRLCKDGSCVEVSLVVSPIRTANDQVIGASTIARDITATKEADRRKNEFLALLAHELRNPLAPLRSGLEIMKLAKNDAETAEATRAMMERQVQQLTRLVDDLLDVSRISRGTIDLRKERVALAAAVNTAVETCEPLIQQADHTLTVTLPDQPIYVYADKTRLAQIFANLLSNAAKYTKRGGQIWITVERDGSDAVICVKDTGIGIPAPMLAKVFELFTQVDRSLEKAQSGLGVGLTIVNRLVEMHGGTVEARSEGHGKGSEFTVRLPADPSLMDQQQSDDDDQGARPITAHRILVVDDNEDAADSLAMMLEILGNEVQTANDGLAAVDVAGRFRPDVILLDIGMPTLNGYDACRRIREQPWGKDLFIVAVTGWGKEEDRARSKEAGFNRHLVKPLEPRVLQKLLAEIA